MQAAGNVREKCDTPQQLDKLIDVDRRLQILTKSLCWNGTEQEMVCEELKHVTVMAKNLEIAPLRETLQRVNAHFRYANFRRSLLIQ